MFLLYYVIQALIMVILVRKMVKYAVEDNSFESNKVGIIALFIISFIPVINTAVFLLTIVFIIIESLKEFKIKHNYSFSKIILMKILFINDKKVDNKNE